MSTSLVRMGKLRVLELYSGIGGMHYALEESGVDYEVAAAIDINNNANDVYRHNFPESRLMQRSIESLTLAQLRKMQISMVLMSPPCQPFTRVGKQKDSLDGRTKSFFHFLQLLEQLEEKPRYILLENVKGFDTSLTRQALLETLQKCSYNVQEFLLTPHQFGVPNSRLRFFLLAKLEPLKFNFPTKSDVQQDLPECAAEFLKHRREPKQNMELNSSESISAAGDNTEPKPSKCLKCSEDCTRTCGHRHQSDVSVHPHCTPSSDISQSESDSHSCNRDDQSHQASSCDDPRTDQSHGSSATSECGACQAPSILESETEEVMELTNRDKYRHICKELHEFVEHQPEEYFRDYLVPEKFFRRFWVMDIVKPDARNACCFTKGYAHHVEGTGSILQMDVDSSVDLREFKVRGIYDDVVHEAVRSMRLRFFTPREIANIMCFPPSFSFLPKTTTMQCYRLLGNSLNVHCVAVLIRLLCLTDENVDLKETS